MDLHILYGAGVLRAGERICKICDPQNDAYNFNNKKMYIQIPTHENDEKHHHR